MTKGYKWPSSGRGQPSKQWRPGNDLEELVPFTLSHVDLNVSPSIEEIGA
jgi:hypothetical protein